MLKECNAKVGMDKAGGHKSAKGIVNTEKRKLRSFPEETTGN